jgi:hypothetical protein
MQKLTITVEDAVYAGLYSVIGRGNISRFLNNLAKAYVTPDELDAAYAEMAADTQREAEAKEWCEAFIGDLKL